ncbi:MAG: sigma-54-dependent Fis family transcriptional regulator [Paludibacteraceae bacterium]|nr:sigma-54-dependent Fis family transcriptional regulator [Paludibacteraceae bacterium]
MSETKLTEIKQRFSIIGNNQLLNRAIERAYLVAPTDYSLLVVGESGVGKEHFPKIVHAYSARKHEQYIAINCGAIPNGTIDSELFGHVKGAFTGAVGDHKGYFEQADGGTVFLDEVGELPLETQVRLLRVLETGEFIKVGSSQVQKTNVRVVAATNVNLQQAIEEGRFREDLFYRLSTITIAVPALRERKEDIPVLFRKFASDCTEKYHMPAVRLTDDATAMLMNYYFRGNIRQLKNIAEQVCVLEQKREINAAILRQYLPDEEQQRSLARLTTDDNRNIGTEREIIYKMLFDMKRDIDQLKQVVAQLSAASQHEVIGNQLPTLTTQHEVINAEYTDAQEVSDTETETQPLSMQEFERETIRKALERNNGSRKAAAAEIGMPERTFYRKIKEYNLG